MNEEAPSWLTPRRRPQPAPAGETTAPPQLRVLVVLTAAVAAAEVAHVAGRDDLVVGFRVALALVVAAQLPLAIFAARRAAAAALGLFVYQATTMLAAVTGGFGDLRAALALGAVAGAVLLATSLHAFPSPALPPITPADPSDRP